MLVISDEIYALTAYGDVRHRSIASYYPEGTIVTGGLSKHLSLGGWRLGVAVLPPGELGARIGRCMSSVAGAVWTTATAPVQHAAIVAYSDDPEIDAYIDACAAIHGRVTRYLYDLLLSLDVPCAEPSGAFYLYPSFRPWRDALRAKHGVETCRELAEVLLREQQIATLPGSDFGSAPHHLALRLATSQLHTLSEENAERVLALAEPQVPDEEFRRAACPDLEAADDRLARFVKSLTAARLAS